MVGSGKVAGLILIGAAIVLEVIAVLWLLSQVGEGKQQGGAFILGLGIAQILALPMFAGGGFLVIKGRQEETDFAEMNKERRILDIVQTQGRVKIADLALQMKLTRDQIQNYLYDLVGKGLFTGYVNWQDGVLVSKTAGEMKTTKCPNCGGEREVVGKGIVKCPYCGSELFVG